MATDRDNIIATLEAGTEVLRPGLKLELSGKAQHVVESEITEVPELDIEWVFKHIELNEWSGWIVPDTKISVDGTNLNRWLQEIHTYFGEKDKMYFWYNYETCLELLSKEDPTRARQWRFLFNRLKLKISDSIVSDDDNEYGIFVTDLADEVHAANNVGEIIDILKKNLTDRARSVGRVRCQNFFTGSVPRPSRSNIKSYVKKSAGALLQWDLDCGYGEVCIDLLKDHLANLGLEAQYETVQREWKQGSAEIRTSATDRALALRISRTIIDELDHYSECGNSNYNRTLAHRTKINPVDQSGNGVKCSYKKLKSKGHENCRDFFTGSVPRPTRSNIVSYIAQGAMTLQNCDLQCGYGKMSIDLLKVQLAHLRLYTELSMVRQKLKGNYGETSTNATDKVLAISVFKELREELSDYPACVKDTYYRTPTHSAIKSRHRRT